MIFEWGTISGDSWKQRVCGLKGRGPLKSKICVYFFLFLFILFFSSFLFVSLKLIILSFEPLRIEIDLMTYEIDIFYYS